MAHPNLARVSFVLPLALLIACGSSNGSGTTSAGNGGHPAGASSTASGSTTASGSGGGGNSTTTASSATSGSGTTSSSGTTTTTGSTTASGSSSSGGTPGACTDAADKMADMTKVGNDASGCVEPGCIGQYLSSDWTGLATCVATCLKTMDTLTSGCAACWGTVVACGAQHCASQCAGGQSTACDTCTDMYCTPAFNTCAGM